MLGCEMSLLSVARVELVFSISICEARRVFITLFWGERGARDVSLINVFRMV
jgi:hypothetical protein